MLLCGALGLHAQPVRAEAVRANAAIEKFDTGNEALLQGRFEVALAAFQDSMALEPSPNTRFKIAKCYKGLGKIASAYVQFHRVVHEAQDRYNATRESRYLPTRDAAEAEAKTLEPDVPILVFKVPAELPPQFVLTLDGTPVPKESWSVDLPIDPGPHRIEASAERTRVFSSALTIELKQRRTLDVVIDRLPTAVLNLRFATRPAGMTTALDGQPLAPDQLDRPQVLDAGEHRVEVNAPGFVPFRWSRALPDKTDYTLPIDLKPETSGLRWAAVALGVAAAVSLGVGTYYVVNAQSMADEQTALPPLLRDFSVRDEVRTRATIGNALFGVGGALGITALTMGIASHFRGGGRAGDKLRGTTAPKVSVLPAGLGVSLSVRY